MEFLAGFVVSAFFVGTAAGWAHLSAVKRLHKKNDQSSAHAGAVHRNQIERKDETIAELEAEKIGLKADIAFGDAAAGIRDKEIADLKAELARHTPAHDAKGHFVTKNGIDKAARDAAKPDNGIAKGQGGKKHY